MFKYLTLATLLLLAPPIQRLKAPTNIDANIIQQAVGDSVQVEVNWDAPTQGLRFVQSYVIDISTTAWTIRNNILADINVTTYADTLTVPTDTVDVTADVCVWGIDINGSAGPGDCGTIVIPAKIVIGPPSLLNIRIISGVSVPADSIQLVMDPDTLIGTKGVWAVAFIDNVMTTCVSLDDGRRGWGEVRITPTYDLELIYGGRFLLDYGCGFEIESQDSTIELTVTKDGPISIIFPGDLDRIEM